MKTAFNFIVILQIFVLSLSAQNVNYNSAGASANLILPLSVTVNGDLDFGDVFVGTSNVVKEIVPSNGVEFKITGQPLRNISIIFSNAQLDNITNPAAIRNNKLTFIPYVTNQYSQRISSGYNTILLSNGLVGELTLNVGGTIEISRRQNEGMYQGTFTITVSY